MTVNVIGTCSLKNKIRKSYETLFYYFLILAFKCRYYVLYKNTKLILFVEEKCFTKLYDLL